MSWPAWADARDPLRTRACPHRGLQRAQRARQITSEVHPERTTVALRQNLEIAPRLCRLHHAERVRPTRHRNVWRVIARDLQEYARIRPTLVALACRVEKARAELEARRDAPWSRTPIRMACSVRSFASVISMYASSAK